jgi:DNA-binding NarL/FixJ family response regulator
MLGGRPSRIVGEADGVFEATRRIEQWRPHVVLVDLNLGDSDGIELLHFITRHWVGVRPIVVSQYPAMRYADRARRAGAAGYVNKSVAPGVICEAVRVVRQVGVYFDPGLSSPRH